MFFKYAQRFRNYVSAEDASYWTQLLLENLISTYFLPCRSSKTCFVRYQIISSQIPSYSYSVIDILGTHASIADALEVLWEYTQNDKLLLPAFKGIKEQAKHLKTRPIRPWFAFMGRAYRTNW